MGVARLLRLEDKRSDVQTVQLAAQRNVSETGLALSESSEVDIVHFTQIADDDAPHETARYVDTFRYTTINKLQYLGHQALVRLRADISDLGATRSHVTCSAFLWDLPLPARVRYLPRDGRS